MAEFNLPTEVVELPSKGLLYPEGSPLSSGKIEMKYMTAREEDILTNVNYIRQGVAIDKLLKALIIDKKVAFNDLLIGDKNAIMVAARILAYGKDYTFNYAGKEYTVDLSQIDNAEIDENLFAGGKNEFEFTLPNTNNIVTFKLLTHGDEVKIDQEVKGKQKINKDFYEVGTTRLKHMITSVNENRDQKSIRDFVDNYLLASDARELRKYYQSINPDVDLVFSYDNDSGEKEEATLPVGVGFFWPDLGL